jgi:hypothetical protein
VLANQRKAQLEITTVSGRTLPFSYARMHPRPSAADRIRDVFVDQELGREGVTYPLASGAEGSVHVDHALEYNEDPAYLAELLIHKLTLEAGRRVGSSGLSRREIARRLRTSVAQLYRLLDPPNSKKTINQLVALLHILDCEVDVVVSDRRIS